MRLALCFLACLMPLSGCGTERSAADDAAITNVACHDAARGVVTYVPPGLCRGEIVDERRAAAIKAARTDHMRDVVLREAVPRPMVGRLVAAGTGFFVDAQGGIVTNQHVIDGCGAVSAVPADGAERPVHVVAIDAPHDLALLRGAFEPPAIASFNPQPATALGVELALIAFPNRGLTVIEPTATPVYTALDARGNLADQYLFRGDVRHGDSGGPILDRGGRVIGVARAKVNTPATYQATGQVVTNIGVAIANRTILAFLTANAIQYRTSAGDDAAPRDLLPQGRRFVVHVRCWNRG